MSCHSGFAHASGGVLKHVASGTYVGTGSGGLEILMISKGTLILLDRIVGVIGTVF